MGILRPEIFLMSDLGYAEAESCRTDLLDCGEGDNPYGTPESALQAWKDSAPSLHHYPHSMALHDALTEYWRPYVSLGRENIHLCSGTIEGIYQIIRLVAKPGFRTIGIKPQFPDFMMAVLRNGGSYTAADQFVSDPLDSIAAQIGPDTTLVYLDNPNNPSGRSFPLHELRRLVAAAKRQGAVVLIDEAYGGYLGPEQSAMLLLPEYDNLLVMRSLSKAWGLAAVRVGYIVASTELSRALVLLNNPYIVPDPIRVVAAAAIKEREFPIRCAAEFARDKRLLASALPDTVTMAPTDPRCPICLLTHTSTQVNLQERLLELGVKTVSGLAFERLGANSVRLRMPHKAKMPRLLASIKKLH